VVAGCAILDAVHRLWPVERLRVADRGLREGILNALLGRSLRQALVPADGRA
jgi:exopolyphosphatase/guanosine-5'-triphosphate,3'-diphosphate pyrophosphatase